MAQKTQRGYITGFGMASSEDEDDRFLYGSDGETQRTVQQKRKLENPTTATVGEPGSKRTKMPAEISEEEEVFMEEEEQYYVSDSDSELSGSDSDSDVEIIIGTGVDSYKLDSKSLAAPSTAATTTSVSDLKIASVSEPSSVGGIGETSAIGTIAGALDINAIGEFEGQPITDIDPEVLKEKPWRQPGGNLSDYFNYGFTEETWMEYLHKQEKLRKEYNPHKVLMGLLALQQQGKLNDKSGNSDSMNSNNSDSTGIALHNDIKSPNKNTLHPPPAFPMGMHHMFGGFPPFPFPGMMPPNINSNSGNNGSNNNTGK